MATEADTGGVTARIRSLARTAFAKYWDSEYRKHAAREAERLRAPFSAAVVGIVLMMLSVAVGLVVFADPALELRALPLSMALVLFAMMLTADCLHRACSNELIADFSYLLYLAAVLHYGIHWELVLAGTLGRFIAHIPLLPAGMPSTFNAGLAFIEMMVAGLVAVALYDQIPLFAVVVVAVIVRVLVNNAIIVTAPFTGGIKEEVVECLRCDWRYLPMLAPYLAAAVYAATVSPLVAFLGVFCASMLSYMATKVDADLVVAESRLDVDGKTGLHNAARFARDLEQLVVTCDTELKPLVAIMIDVDNFKQLNDTCGHLQGDVALRATAEAISRSVRSQDIAARYGGEEFSVLLPDVTLEQAAEVAERIRVAVQEGLEPWDGSASLGLAYRLPGSEEADQMLHRADEALYVAKNRGKNRVEISVDEAPGQREGAVAA